MIERSRVQIPAGAAGEFSSPGSTFCADSFRYPFHPRVTAVARKRSRSFCQKCKWQVTAKHAYTVTYVALHEVTWSMAVHRICAETAAVSCGTTHASAVSTPLRWIFKKCAIKLVTHVEPHASAVSLLICSREWRIVLYKRSSMTLCVEQNSKSRLPINLEASPKSLYGP